VPTTEEWGHEAICAPQADRIAKARAPKPRMHFFWWGQDETYDKVKARIRAAIASGEASPNDRFVTFTWTQDDDDAGE
jgi:hypothetical protein